MIDDVLSMMRYCVEQQYVNYHCAYKPPTTTDWLIVATSIFRSLYSPPPPPRLFPHLTFPHPSRRSLNLSEQRWLDEVAFIRHLRQAFRHMTQSCGLYYILTTSTELAQISSSTNEYENLRHVYKTLTKLTMRDPTV